MEPFSKRSISLVLLALLWVGPNSAGAGTPAARTGDDHVCPMATGTVPHGGGPITGGDSSVLICQGAAARLGDAATCTGAPDSLAEGSGTVLIAGKPAVRTGDKTAHGGTVTEGCDSVLIGD